MPAESLPNDVQILADAYGERISEVFKVFAEAIYTGEPERDAVVRFRRGLVSARRAYDAALVVINEGGLS
jgi:hypothetical protein